MSFLATVMASYQRVSRCWRKSLLPPAKQFPRRPVIIKLLVIVSSVLVILTSVSGQSAISISARSQGLQQFSLTSNVFDI